MHKRIVKKIYVTPTRIFDIYQSLFEFVQIRLSYDAQPGQKGSENGVQALSFMKNRRQINICIYF
jgi:hypothetical protein